MIRKSKSGKFYLGAVLSSIAFLFCGISAQSPAATPTYGAVEITRNLVGEVAARSFPEVNLKKVRIKTFKSKSSYFKARFSLSRFFTFRPMRKLIFTNPKLYELGAPESGVRAIIAHELAHVSYYKRKNRFELLGLAGLLSSGFSAKFERRADLEAVSRGYGEGLIAYRQWLYKNIPQRSINAKRRLYFTPEELKVILEVLKEKPEMMGVWKKRVPRNMEDLRKSVR